MVSRAARLIPRHTSYLFNYQVSNCLLAQATATSAKLAIHLVPTILFRIHLKVVDTEATVSIDLDAQAPLDQSPSDNASANADDNTAQLELGGCVDVATWLSINGDADTGLFKLFEVGVSYRLWGPWREAGCFWERCRQ